MSSLLDELTRDLARRLDDEVNDPYFEPSFHREVVFLF